MAESSTLQPSILKAFVVSGFAFFLTACAGMETDPGPPPTPEQLQLFPGYYQASLQGGVTVDMSISPQLEFEFNQPLAARTVKTVKGTLVVTGDRTANARRVKLEWESRNSLSVRSPYGSSMETGSSAGATTSSFGANFTLRRQ